MTVIFQQHQISTTVIRALGTGVLCLLVAASANPQAARAEDDNVARLIERANKARDAYNWSYAQKLANEALELDPNQRDAHVVLGAVAEGQAIQMKKDPERRAALFSECVAEFRKALSIEFRLGVAQGAVQCALDAGDPSSAVQIAEEQEQWFAKYYSPAQLAADGNYAICRSKKGEAMAALGRRAEAIVAYESGVRVALAMKKVINAVPYELPAYLQVYNEYRVKVGLPAISADQLTAATAESVAAELNLSPEPGTSTAIVHPGSSAPAQAAPSFAGSAAQEPISAAAAPPGAAANSAIAQSYPLYFLVFFDANSAALTGAARTVLQEAVKKMNERHPTAITVTGHTDTLGTGAANQALSERRAAAVKSFLVSAGIAAASINASGKGETELMVQTADETREAQNNRVTVDF